MQTIEGPFTYRRPSRSYTETETTVRKGLTAGGVRGVGGKWTLEFI